jgi:hypothetical protein
VVASGGCWHGEDGVVTVEKSVTLSANLANGNVKIEMETEVSFQRAYNSLPRWNSGRVFRVRSQL